MSERSGFWVLGARGYPLAGGSENLDPQVGRLFMPEFKMTRVLCSVDNFFYENERKTPKNAENHRFGKKFNKDVLQLSGGDFLFVSAGLSAKSSALKACCSFNR